MPDLAVWCPVFHFHQPLYDGSTRHFYDECAGSSYAHHLEVLKRHPGIKVTYNVTGVLLEQMARYNPELIKGFREGIEKGQIGVTLTAYYHAILPLVAARYGEGAVRMHLEKDLELKKKLFEVQPRVLRLPEYAISEDVVRIASNYADHILISGKTVARAGIPTDKIAVKGETKLLCRDDGLSNRLCGLNDGWRNNFRWLKDGASVEDVGNDFIQAVGGRRVLTDFDGEAIMHHMLVCGVPSEKAERYLDGLYTAAERRWVRTVHVPELASSMEAVKAGDHMPESSYAGGLEIWHGNGHNNGLWGNIDGAWATYKTAESLGGRNGNARLVRRMKANAMKAQTSCYTWGDTFSYPEWWLKQPEKYRKENERLLSEVTHRR